MHIAGSCSKGEYFFTTLFSFKNHLALDCSSLHRVPLVNMRRDRLGVHSNDISIFDSFKYPKFYRAVCFGSLFVLCVGDTYCMVAFLSLLS